MAFEPTSWKCRVGAELEGCEFRLWSDLSDFWPKSPDTVRPNADLSDQSRTLSRSRRTPSRSTTLKITQQCVEVVSRLCYLTESLNSGDSLKESDFGRTVSGLLAQKSDSPRLVGPYPDSWAKSRKVGASKSAPTRHFQEVGSKAKRSDHLPFLECTLVR